jgi:hypothetical protein
MHLEADGVRQPNSSSARSTARTNTQPSPNTHNSPNTISQHQRQQTSVLQKGFLKDFSSLWLHACRYDVKYGSQGFNLFGYQAGCSFSLGTYAQAALNPVSDRYLCPQGAALSCVHDLSGEGVCYESLLWDGFARSLPVRANRIHTCKVGCTGRNISAV